MEEAPRERQGREGPPPLPPEGVKCRAEQAGCSVRFWKGLDSGLAQPFSWLHSTISTWSVNVFPNSRGWLGVQASYEAPVSFPAAGQQPEKRQASWSLTTASNLKDYNSQKALGLRTREKRDL